LRKSKGLLFGTLETAADQTATKLLLDIAFGPPLAITQMQAQIVTASQFSAMAV
jgi:hypothetical protein